MDLLPAMMIAALLVSGQGVAILGSIKVALAERLSMDEAKVGGMVSLFGFTMIPVIPVAGLLTDQVGRQVVLVAGCVLLAISLIVLGWARSYLAALLSIVLFSAGWSLLINVGNVLTPVAFGGDIARATNLANFFFGLGAFLTPVAVIWMLKRMSFPGVLGILAAFALVPAVLSVGVDFAAIAPPSAVATGDVAYSLLADPLVWLCGLALFFYGPMEASMAAWATTYLAGRGVKETTASSLLSGFWLAYMASRLGTAFLLPAGMETVLITALALVSVGVIGIMVASRHRALSMVLVPAAGLVLGPIFPTVIAVLFGHVPASAHGRAVGMFFAIGGVGWTMIPMLVGAYARKVGIQRAFIIVGGAAVGLTIIAVSLWMLKG